MTMNRRRMARFIAARASFPCALRAMVAAFLLAASGAAFAQNVTRGPYLQRGTPQNVTVRWRTDSASDSVVRYGAQPGSLDGQVTDTAFVTEHHVVLSGLASDTLYYYSVGTSSQTLAGDDGDHFFVTSPLPGTAKTTRIWVLGDSGTADTNAAAVRDAYLDFTGSVHTDLWLMLGDNAYNSGTDAEYQQAVFNMYPTMLRKSVLWSTIGNHDGASADSASESGPYYEIFTLPRSGEAGGLASGTEAYYSFDYGNIHFVCLDSHETDRSPEGAMIAWLEADLMTTVQDWVIAFWHHPPYSKGSHNSDTELQLVEMRENALPILEAGGVDLVLSGHSHSYERSYLLDGHYGASSTLTSAMVVDSGDGSPAGDGAYEKPALDPGAHEGAVYVVSGSSGKTSGGSLNHPAMVVSLNLLGSLVLDVSGTQLDARWIQSNGVVRDHFRITKGAGTPPAAPSGLAAATVSATQIDLGWTDNSLNETAFDVERSVDGANWVPVASAGAGTEAYSDTGLTPATTYYYRVHAVNGFGASAPSNVAQTTTFEEGIVDIFAEGESLVAGTLGGSFLDTHADDGVYETVTERLSGGKLANRYSFAEHKWTFTVPPSSAIVLYIDAYHTQSGEGDDFAVAYSADNTSYTDLLLLDRTAPGTEPQMAVLPATLSGSLVVRVRDLDRTGGNQTLDSLFVDQLFVRSMSGPADTVPPAPPTGLSATAAGARRMDLDWDDSPEADFAVYSVYRGTASGAVSLLLSGLTASSLSDETVLPETTYHYVVTATDLAGNESEDSNEASATTPACQGTTMEVASLTVSVENLGKGEKRGRAEVTILDDCGLPVQGATVTASFSGPFPDAEVAATTGTDGVAVLHSDVFRGSSSLTVCVVGVSGAELIYSGAPHCESS